MDQGLLPDFQESTLLALLYHLHILLESHTASRKNIAKLWNLQSIIFHNTETILIFQTPMICLNLPADGIQNLIVFFITFPQIIGKEIIEFWLLTNFQAPTQIVNNTENYNCLKLYDHWHTCSSVAFSSMKSSKVELTTYSGRAEGLSILFTTTTTEWPNSKAFFKTNLVCGIGPSTESTYIKQKAAW